MRLPTDIEKWPKWKLSDKNGCVFDLPGTRTRVLIDTGASEGISLGHRIWRRWRAEHFQQACTLTGQFYRDSVGSAEECWAGEWKVGDLAIHGVPLLDGIPIAADYFFDQLTDGANWGVTAGMFALTRWEVILDGPGSAIYIREKANPRTRYTSYSRLGAVFVDKKETNDDVPIARVARGSPAERAGLRNGDELLRVDGKDVSASSYAQAQMALGAPAGTKVMLELRRDGKTFTTTATLEDILSPGASNAAPTRVEDKNEALQNASLLGRTDEVRRLLAEGASVNAADPDSLTSLMLAAQEGQSAVVEVLLAAKADVNANDPNGWTSLAYAAAGGYTNVVTILLRARADIAAEPRAKNGIGPTALMAASSHNQADAVRMLLAAGARADYARKKDGATALMMACTYGCLEAAKALLLAGEDVNRASRKDRLTCLHAASQDGHIEVVQLLLDAKADVNAKAKGGFTALYMACLKGKTEVVRKLLDAHADVNAADLEGRTPLFAAVGNPQQAKPGDIEIVKLLIAAGAKPQMKDKRGFKALDYAERTNFSEAANYLKTLEAVDAKKPDAK